MHNFMLKRLLFILLFFPSIVTLAQDIPIGDWRDHLPYSDAVSITYGNHIIYCATGSAVFMYDENEKTVERLNLVNGLSDIGLSKIKFNPNNNKIIIAYSNGNLDVINDDKEITNLSFIKNSNVVGSKTINHIYIVGNLAYLSTGFGIVVLDTDKLEIVDTYLFGPLGSFVITHAITMDNINIYAATDQGVFFANKNNTNLIDYNVWSLLPDLGTSSYSNIVTYSNRIFVASESSAYNGDTIYYNDAGIWQKFLPNGYNLNSINVSQGYLLISFFNSVEKYDTSLTKIGAIIHHKQLFNVSPAEAIINNEGYFLIADESHGALRVKDNWSGDVIAPNGPSSTSVFEMDFQGGDLWVVSGGYNPTSYTTSNIDKNLFNYSSNSEWLSTPETFFNINGQPAEDAVSVAINPGNKNQTYIGTWNDGLFELNNGVTTNIYTAQNSVLDSTSFGTAKVGGLAFDKDNNLWILSSFSNIPLAVKTANNEWYNYVLPSNISSSNVLTQLIVSKDNYKWVVEPRINSVIVYDDNNTISDPSDDRSVVNGNIPGSRLHSIAEDLDGEIWIGTDEGVSVFYNPSSIFDNNIEAERIFIQQDGQTQILFETEIVTAIKVDGANRKWIGTQTSGVFLMSEDGTEQIEHFTTANSPLFSNDIFDIDINPKTGEVFFATGKGIISYKGTATEANDDFDNVFVYPNPVKPDFNGTIAIRGLVGDTDVRITDISGNIVYQTTSLGGQAIWDGKDFNGNRVQTGVYMIFNGSPEGDLKAAAKILFIN